MQAVKVVGTAQMLCKPSETVYGGPGGKIIVKISNKLTNLGVTAQENFLEKLKHSKASLKTHIFIIGGLWQVQTE